MYAIVEDTVRIVHIEAIQLIRVTPKERVRKYGYYNSKAHPKY